MASQRTTIGERFSMHDDRDYSRIALTYAKDVVAKRVAACRFVQLACKRFMNDLKRQDLEYRSRKVTSVCRFIEKLKHIKGKWARTPIVLEPWQIFILANVFGFYWVETGNRRFRTVYSEIPRKNAKSTLTSGVGLYCTALDGEGGAEVYSAATTRDQAKIVFVAAKKMVDNNQEVRERAGLSTSAHAIVHEESGSVFKALSADHGSLDGLNVSAGLIDEFHAHKNADLHDVIDTATGSRENPLIWIITTAGDDIGRPCYEKREYAINILEGRVNDAGSDAMFAIVYTVDKGDDWMDPKVWAKANPNYGISVNPEDMKIKAASARQSPVKLAAFKTKHLNIWVSSSDGWITPEDWSECGNKEFDRDEHDGEMAWIGVDLAARRDIVGVQVLIRSNSRWYTFGNYYVPEARIEEDGMSEYKSWKESGHLIVTDGNTVDFEAIKSDIVDFCGKFDVQNIAYDPFQAAKLVNELNEMDLPTIEVRQTFAHLSEPMKELESQILKNGIEHDNNPCMNWMMSNVVAKSNDVDNIRPVKETSKKKIDGPVALIMAFALAHRDFVKGSVYDERGSVFA